MASKIDLFEPSFDDFGRLESISEDFTEFSFPGVYALFDKAEKCLYVGQSVSIPARLRQHTKKKWFPKVSYRRTLRLEDEEDRLVREAVLVLAYRPRNNHAISLWLRKDGSIYERFLRVAKKT